MVDIFNPYNMVLSYKVVQLFPLPTSQKFLIAHDPDMIPLSVNVSDF